MADADKLPHESFEHDSIEGHMNPETDMHKDAINAWSSVNFAIMMETVTELHPILTYEQYFEEKTKDDEYSEIDDLVGKILALTNKERMEEYDKIVEEYNRNLPKIIETKNFDALEAFHRMVFKVINDQDLTLYD